MEHLSTEQGHHVTKSLPQPGGMTQIPKVADEFFYIFLSFYFQYCREQTGWICLARELLISVETALFETA